MSGEEKILGPGKYIDVVSLLSSYGGRDLIRNNGDRVALRRDTFGGKHVLLCCFNAPAVADCTRNFRCLVTLCNELCSTRKEKHDFEMVVVARSEEEDNKEASDHLFSWFPDSCLTVPFGNRKRHDYICKELGLDAGDRDSFQCVFVNAEGMVSPFPSFHPYDDDILTEYGAEAFPFTEDVIKEKDEECRRVVFEESNNLEAVLRCDDSSPDYVYKFGGGGGAPGDRLHISELSNKHVGLLLCSTGDLVNQLVERYEQCRKNKLDFEVVVVYSPRKVMMGVRWPHEFKERIDDFLQESYINTCHRWWCLPFNDSVIKRFWRMTRGHYTDKFWTSKLQSYADEGDKLIVVGPGVEHLDMYGGEVMKCEGISGYPFTTEAAIANKVKKLQELTLESLFAGTGVTRGGDGRVVPIGELKASKVFLYFHPDGRGFDFETISPVYREMKKRYGYEMVLVEVGANLVPNEEHIKVEPGVISYRCPITGFRMGTEIVSDEERREIESKIPCYFCPLNEPLKEVLRAVGKRDYVLVGFGDDGRVCNLFDTLKGFSLHRCFTPRKTSLYHQVEKFLGFHHLKRNRRNLKRNRVEKFLLKRNRQRML